MTTPTTTLKVTFVSESADYESTFGWYNKVTGYGGILFADVEQQGSHAPLTPGVSSVNFTVNTADLGNIEFFLVSDGYNLNQNDADDLTGAIKVIQLSDGSWAVADVDSHGNVITDHGKADILKGQGANALFTETSKNAGGVDYASSVAGTNQTAATLAGDTANGPTGTIAWEDLVATRNHNGTYSKPGDADYNDAVFNITTVSTNHTPVANADSASIGEDAGQTTINVLANDTDADAGDTLHVSAVNAAGVLGTVTISSNGLGINYTPAASFQSLRAGQTATETFTYTVADQAGATSSATVTVTIVGANDGPVAVNDSASATEAGGVNNGTPGVNPTGNVLTNDTDPDSGDTKTVSAVAGLSGNVGQALAGSFGTLTLNADGSYSYAVNNANASVQGLRTAANTLTDSFTYTVKDSAGATSTATLAVTIHGANDAPTAVADTNAGDAVTESGVADGGNTPFAGDPTASGNVLVNDADVDSGDTKSVTTAGTFTGTYGTLTLASNGSYTYTLSNADTDTNALAQGESASDVFAYTIVDSQGATSSSTLTIAITGTNDQPVITGGATTGSVQEDTISSATGKLVVADPDHGALQFWSVVGGSGAANADYHFRADSFSVVKGATSVLQDDFSDGLPPPNSPPLNVGGPNQQATTYIVTGGFTESGGELHIDSNNAVSVVDVGSPDPLIGQVAIVRTNIDPASTLGLKLSQPFTVTGIFDLVVPDSPREQYGIRLTDRLIGGGGNPPDQVGDNTYDLVVRESTAGQKLVTLRHIDFFTNVTTNLQNFTLAPSGADQIKLVLDHVANSTTVQASFQYLLGGSVVGGNTFAATAPIFDPGSADTEVWTRAGIVAFAPATSDSLLSGLYGNLDIDQTGTWTYTLDNTRTPTQNLAAGQHATDAFTVQVADQFGATDNRTINIDVVGTNDAPIMQTLAVSRALTEDSGVGGSGNLTATGLAQFSDVDLTDTHTTTAVLQSTTLSSGSLPPGLAILLANAIAAPAITDPSTGDGHGGLQWNFALANSAVQFLAAGETLTAVYNVNVTDTFGATATQAITVTISGTNDAPVITGGVTSGAVQEDGVQSATGTLNATDVDHGATQTWNVIGGNAGHVTQYHTTIDEFKIQKVVGVVPTVIFDDTFTGTNPPTSPAGQPPYGPTNQFTNANGRAVADNNHATTAFSISDPLLDFTGQPTGTIGNFASVSTNIDPASTMGLKSGSSFTISGVYDLIQSEASYGIRLSNTNGAISFAGNDVVDLSVRTFPTGLAVQLTQIDFVGGSFTPLQTISFNPLPGDDQILLELSNDAATNGVIHGAFTLLNHGVIDQTVNFTGTGHIFDHDSWTRGSFETTAPGNTSSFVNGIYGALAINQSGAWTYLLANGQSNVQALAQGQHATDTFTVQVADQFGATDSRVINVDVVGSNDAPTITSGPQSGNVSEGDDGASKTAIGQITSNDVDLTDGHAYTVLGAATYGTASVDQNGNWSYTVGNSGAVNALASGQHLGDVFTVQVDDGHGGFATQSVNIDIVGTNDAPTITSGPQSGNVSEGDDGASKTAIGQITYNDVDLTDGHAYTVLGAATYGTASVDQTGNWSYTVGNSSTVNALASGQHLGDVFTVQVDDGHGGFATQSVNIDIVGTNDAPAVTGAVTGSVTEDSPATLQTRGILSSSDPDGGTPTWSIVGGATAPQTQDFRFQLDNLKVIKNGVTFFEDTFGEGGPPPNGPAFPPATGVNSTAYTTQGAFTEAAGRALFDGTAAVVFGTTNYGERALLNSDTSPLTDPVNGPKGLKSNNDFTAEARFDLITPQDGGDTYGIRLSDQNSPNNNSSADLVLLRDATGLHVALREINLGSGLPATTLQSIDLTIPSQSQIVLRLAYDHTSYVNSTAGGSVTASFDIVTNGVTVSTTSFSSHGTIFQGEDFTQVQVVGQSNQAETGVYKLAGTYGTLTVAQDGEWHYFLADQQANVQALTQGQQVTDNFTVRVNDGHGGITDKPVSITVNGVNDVAVIGNPTVADVTEDLNVNGANNLTASGTISITDVDTGQAAFQTSVTPFLGNLGSLTLAANGSYTYSVANSAVQSLSQNAFKIDTFTVTSVDGTSKQVNFTIHGVNDAPVANPDSAAVIEQGTVLNVDQPVLGNPFAGGNVVLNDTDAEHDLLSVTSIAAGPIIVPLNGHAVLVAGTYGSLTINPNGVWNYALDNSNLLTNGLTQGQAVADIFTYTVSDGFGGSSSSTVTVNITGTNDAPAATPLKHEVLEGSGLHKLDLLHGATDPEGDAVSVASISSPWSFLTLDADGHTVNFNTSDPWFDNMSMGQAIDYNFSYDLVDSHGLVSHQIATFRVVGTDDAPTIGVDGQNVVIASGGSDPGVPDAVTRLFTNDRDWIGLGPGNVPIQQPVLPDTTGWTANGDGTYSKAGIYGTAVWNPAATSENGTLTYHLDNNDPDTLALSSSDHAFDTFAVTYTDGTLSSSLNISYEVVGRDDMYGHLIHWDVLYPTDQHVVGVDPFLNVAGVTTSFVVGDQVELTGLGDANINLTRDKIIIDYHTDTLYPVGGNYVDTNGGVHLAPPGPGDTWSVALFYPGNPFNGFRVSDLPTLQNVSLESGSPNTPPMHWDSNDVWVNNQGLFYPAGSEQVWDLTFNAGTPIDAPLSNLNFVDVGATNQSIGPNITIYDGFTLDLNVAYSGTVHFAGPTGTLNLANANFTGTVDNFLTNAEVLDFSAITHGNANIVGNISGSTLAEHSVGWVTSGNDTTVYVNASDQNESVAAGPSYSADLAVHLQNVVQLHNHDFFV